MLMQERFKSSTDCRFGFQGQELDNEIKGKGNSVNYKYRMHSPRICRFFAVDPLTPEYPHNSPYAFSENVVINAIELEGLEADRLSDVTYVDKIVATFEWDENCRSCGTTTLTEVQTREILYKDGTHLKTTTSITVIINAKGEIESINQWTRSVITDSPDESQNGTSINNADITEYGLNSGNVPGRLRTIALEVQKTGVSPSEKEAKDNVEFNDTKDNVSDGMTYAGGVVFALGIALDETIIGLPAGVTLNMIGGIITGIGVGLTAINDYEVDAEKITVEINPQKIYQTEPSIE